ncbi:MAG: DUF6941 family protein [Vulcanimicrobiaceae bacterium]
MLLADAAQVTPDGKLHALGLGWGVTPSPMTSPAAIAMIFHVPWDEANRKFGFSLQLLDGDGGPVMLPGPSGSIAIRFEQQMEVGRPPGIKPGTTLNAPFVVSVGPMPLQADSTFEWVVQVGDVRRSAAFATRPLPRKP